MTAKKKNLYQLEKKQTQKDQKAIREAQKAEYQPTEDYQPLYRAIHKLAPIDPNRYR